MIDGYAFNQKLKKSRNSIKFKNLAIFIKFQIINKATEL